MKYKNILLGLLLLHTVFGFSQNTDGILWKIENKKHHLLFEWYRDRRVGSHADNSYFFESDIKIKLPILLKCKVIDDRFFFFIYKNNQAIIVNNTSTTITIKIDYTTHDTVIYTNYTERKDTTFVPTEEEMDFFTNSQDFELLKNKYYRKFRYLVNDVNLEDYPKGHKNLVIYKNGVRILLFNIKQKNIDKWAKIVQEVEVFPCNKEEETKILLQKLKKWNR
jgi:hypothetical protein